MRRGLRVCGMLTVAVTCASASCASGTGNQRFSFEARIAGEGPGTAESHTFVNEKGWTIALSRAEVTLGPVYLNVIAPLTDTTTTFLDFFVRSAWAYGEDHLHSGRVAGEVLAQVTFDALSAEPTPFPRLGTMTQEPVRTAEVWFFPAPGVPGDTKRIDTVALDVAGTASREGLSVPFRGQLVLNDDWLLDQTQGQRGNLSITGMRQVRGIAAPFFPSEGGRLDIGFDISRLFRGAEFSSIATNPSDDDGTKRLVQKQTSQVSRDQVMTNLYQGLRETNGTYSVHWAAP